MSQVDNIHHLNLTVRDLEASMAWYGELFGMQRSFERESAEYGWLKAGLLHPETGFRLNFTQHRPGSTDRFSEVNLGMDHVAFHVTGGKTALETWINRLDERGIEHSEIKRGDVGDVITFRDPDNIQLELYATEG